MVFRHDLRGKATQVEILEAFADRLKSIPGMNSETVIICDQPIPILMPQGRFQLVVAPGDASFNVQAAHAECFRETSGIVVGIFVLNRRDRPGRSESKLLADQSLMYWKHKVLAYLALNDLKQQSKSPPWEPTKTIQNGDVVPLLRSIPVPTKATSPRDVDGHDSWIGIQIYYSVEFDWDLYSAKLK